MPIYEYRCEDCHHEMEAIQKMADPPLSDCPSCGAPALKKKISAVGFRLKGSGWYETDFKNSDKKKNIANKDDAPSSDAKTADSNKTKESAKNKESSASQTPKDKAAANSS
jgi:putative FmdB family regulatory protein